ncbi:hypothetical protein TIFTF001_053388 [Ficus carica]|uniref:Uncharacterized protein n=1 Tax=Ficus carica TaxID=3494 RepID=A0AA88JGG8_FICCA|nr:hypothetical protein TIFTF001_053388 [Ficus carica]
MCEMKWEMQGKMEESGKLRVELS